MLESGCAVMCLFSISSLHSLSLLCWVWEPAVYIPWALSSLRFSPAFVKLRSLFRKKIIEMNVRTIPVHRVSVRIKRDISAKWLCPYLIKCSVAGGSTSKNLFILEITAKIKYSIYKSVYSTVKCWNFVTVHSWHKLRSWASVLQDI